MPLAADILEFLRRYPDGVSVVALKAMLPGVGVRTLHNSLHRLLQVGRIERCAYGVYRAAIPARRVPPPVDPALLPRLMAGR